MLTILRVVFSIITFALAGYGFITKNFEFQTYMILFLGLTMLIMGIQEFQNNKKGTASLLFCVFAFSLIVSIQSLILR